MKKKIFAFLFVLCLVAALFPVSALAAGNTGSLSSDMNAGIPAAGTFIINNVSYDATLDAAGTGTAGTWSYTAATNTFVLDGFVGCGLIISGFSATIEIRSDCVIYPANEDNGLWLLLSYSGNITLSGSGTLALDGNNRDLFYGARIDGSLTIDGPTVKCLTPDSIKYSFSASGDLNVVSGTLIADGDAFGVIAKSVSGKFFFEGAAAPGTLVSSLTNMDTTAASFSSMPYVYITSVLPISPAEASFDKSAPADIAFSAPSGIISISNGAYTLTAGTDYTVTDTGITLTKTYLNTLATGDYTLTFNYGASATLTVLLHVTGPVYDSTPKTGDASGLLLLSLMSAFSLGGAALLFFGGRTKKDR